jgi:EAL and modified HD-GYP domain-containing signal transduction protein
MNTTSEVLFARQPILDESNKLYGFELLYRGNLSLDSNAREATLDVIVNCCTGMLDTSNNPIAPIFINLDETFITSELYFPIAPEFVILEILESVTPTPEVLKVLAKLNRQGYVLALDDFTFEEHNHLFLPFISIIKIDVLAFPIDTLQEKLKEFNFSGKTLLAEKIESKEVYDRCVALGFSLFQGYYLEKPQMMMGKKLETSKHAMLRIVNELSHEDISVQEVSDLITTEPFLMLKILKMVNCPIYPSKREITTLKEAVVKLGVMVVKRWAIIFSLLSVSTKPIELFRTLLIRAKHCELYAQAVNDEHKDNYFLIGLFSGLDAILNVDLEAIIGQMKLSDHIKDELLGHNHHSILNMIKAFEKVDCKQQGELSNETVILLNSCYWQAASWSDELMELVFH